MGPVRRYFGLTARIYPPISTNTRYTDCVYRAYREIPGLSNARAAASGMRRDSFVRAGNCGSLPFLSFSYIYLRYLAASARSSSSRVIQKAWVPFLSPSSRLSSRLLVGESLFSGSGPTDVFDDLPSTSPYPPTPRMDPGDGSLRARNNARSEIVPGLLLRFLRSRTPFIVVIAQ